MERTTKMHEAENGNRWYQVRQGRPLFFADPSTPGVDKSGGNLWAAPGSYVEASHPVLKIIIKSQLSKVRRLKDGEVIPKGSIVRDAQENPAVQAMIRKYDGRVAGEVTAEEIVVGKDHGKAPSLKPNPAIAAKARAEAEAAKRAAEEAERTAADAEAAEAEREETARATAEVTAAKAAAEAEEKDASEAAEIQRVADEQAAAEAAKAAEADSGGDAAPAGDGGDGTTEIAGAEAAR